MFAELWQFLLEMWQYLLEMWQYLLENSKALNDLGLIVIGAIGLPLLWVRTRATHKQAEAANEQARIANVQARTAERGHITDRFTKAIEQLGSEKLAVRLGAIYALERLSKDSPGDHWTIMEVLTAYLRKEATAPWALAIESGEAGKIAMSQWEAGLSPDMQHIVTALAGKEGPLKLRADTEIQAILTVIGRRKKKVRQREIAAGRRLDLAVTDLRGAFLDGAHLEYACLAGADFRLSSLRGAHLDKAQLHQANLQGAHFLTQEQLDAADGNEDTTLPEGLSPAGVPYVRPPHWFNPAAAPATPPPVPPLQTEAPPGSPSHTSH